MSLRSASMAPWTWRNRAAWFVVGTLLGIVSFQGPGSSFAEGAKKRTWDFESDEPGRIAGGFSAEVGWPDGATEGSIAVQIANVNQDSAYHTVGTIDCPHLRYDTPAGISANFARLMVVMPPDSPMLTGRILVR